MTRSHDNKSDHNAGIEFIEFRSPIAADGRAVWELIKQAGTLDLNSAYCYIMLCDQFADTCAVAVSEGEIVGFISAYRQPTDLQTLFIWQIAVSPAFRGKKVALQLVKELLLRDALKGTHYLELTISPSNAASQGLFKRVAEEWNTHFEERDGYPAAWFPEGTHEEERKYRIGPLMGK